MKKALVSLAVGDRCFGPWSRFLNTNWSAWCQRHGYELILFDSLLDTSTLGLQRSPAWQKLLAMSAPSLLDYDMALWLDADVLICPNAEDPIHHANISSVCMSRDVGSPLAYEPNWFKNEWSRVLCNSLLRNHGSSLPPNLFSRPDCFSYYQLWGFNQMSIPLYNTGVILFNPALHSSLFYDVYCRWNDGGPGSLYEMIPLNLELIQRQLIHELPVRFNQLAGVQHAVWSFRPQQVQALHDISPTHVLSLNQFLECLTQSSSFLHFAGAHQLMIDFLLHCQMTKSLCNSLSLCEAH